MFKIKHVKVMGILSGIILYILISWKAFFKILKDFPFHFGILLLTIVILYAILFIKYKNTDRNEFIFLCEFLGILALVLITSFVLPFIEGNVFLSNQFNSSSFLLILITILIISAVWGFQIWLKMWYVTLLIFGGMFAHICGTIILQFYKLFNITSILLCSGGKIALLVGLIIIPQIKLKSFLKERSKEKINEKIKDLL